MPPAPLNGASAPWVKDPNARTSPNPQGGGPRPLGQYEVSQLPPSQAQGFANPGSAMMQRLQQGRPGTPPSAGRPGLPAVPSGSMPGQSTPFNPAQMARPGSLPAIPRPGAMGSPGPTPMPGRQRADLSTLGASIQQSVQSRLASSQRGVAPGVSPATPGTPVGNSLENLGERIRASVAGNTGSVQPAAPGAGGANLGPATQSIMDRVRQQIGQAMPANGTTPFPQPPTQGAAPAPGGLPPIPAPVPPGGVPSTAPAPTTAGGPSNAGEVANFIIKQETGGAAWTPNNTNCDIRPDSGCLDLNTGIFQTTATSRGVDWDRLMTDPAYANEAVTTVLSSIAKDDAGGWTGSMGVSVWDYGEQNLPGGGWEAVGRYYFGGCVTSGCFVDEQGRSVDTYGQQFIEKLNGAGIATGAGASPMPGTEAAAPADDGLAPPQPPYIVTDAGGRSGQGGMVPGGAPTESTGEESVLAPVPSGTVASGSTRPVMNTDFSGSLSAATDPMAPGQFKPQFIVYHMTDGTSFGGAGTFDQDGDKSPDGSTNYIIDTDGTIYELVPPGSAMPWANGQTQGVGAVNPEKVALLQAANEDNLNNRSISIEMVGMNGEPLTQEQIAAGQSLTGYLSGQYNIPLDDQHLVGHNEITGDRMDPVGSYDPMDMVPTGATGNPSVSSSGPNPITPPTSMNAAVGTGDIVTDSSGKALSMQDISYGLGAPGTPGIDYSYGLGHGTDGTTHTGIDVGVGYGEPYYAPISGTVTCQGTDDGRGSWGTGCGMFGNADGGGTGRVEVLADNNVSYIFGHTLQGSVQNGQRITPGMQLGTAGWSPEGGHYHLEARVWCENIGTYWIVDPNQAARVADGSQLCPR